MHTWVARYVHTAYGLRLERYLLGKMNTATACVRTQLQLSQVKKQKSPRCEVCFTFLSTFIVLRRK
jgi:hypothetical protein